jgi:MFS family permease
MQSSSSPSETNPFRSQSSSEVFHAVNLSSLREKHTPINNNNINNTRDGQREQIREEEEEEEEEESRDRNHARASVQEYTVEEAIDHVGFGMFQIIFLSITGLSWLCDAMEMMLLSFIGPSARCEWNLTTTEASSLTSFVFLGMGFGAPSFGMLADRRGRLFALRCSTALTMLAGVGSAMSPTFSGLCFARMVVGFGLGGVPVAYNLCAEYLPTKNRGVYLSSLEFFWSFGSMISAILAWTILPKQSWRVLLGVTVSPLILLGLFLIYMPDSPMYLASKGRLDEAERTLRFISRLNRKPLPVGVLKVADQDKKKRDAEFDARLSETDTNTTSEQREMTNLQGNIYTDDEYSLSFFSSMKGYVWNRTPMKMQRLLVPKFRKTTLSLWFLFFAVAFLYYGLVLLTTTLKLMDDDSGGDGKKLICLAHNSPDLTNADYRDITLSAFSELPGMIAAMVCIDTLGRKKSTMLGFIVAAICFLPVMQSSKRSVITAFLAIARSSSMASFTVLFAYSSEVYPTQIRGTGVGIANTFSRIAGMIVPLFAVNAVRAGAEEFVLFLFGVIALISAFVVSRLERETMGMHLDAAVEKATASIEMSAREQAV